MINIDYSESLYCDECGKVNNQDVYDIWQDGDCIITLCKDCLENLRDEINKYLTK